jgi:uncharacterized membrane protein YedE/YeeE
MSTAREPTDASPAVAAAHPQTAQHRRPGAWAPAAALGCGLVFGVGLATAQMTDPLKVLGFLDVAGGWDPSLMLVMGAAVAVAAIGFRSVLRLAAPRYAARFRLPAALRVDAGLIVGSVVFGVGWGIAGYCPGPAISSVGLANPEVLWFLPAFAVGAGWQRWQQRRHASCAPQTPADPAAGDPRG